MIPTPFGLRMIRCFERFRAKPYLDQGSKPTIGYGHLILPGEVFTEITEERAGDLLAVDAVSACRDIDALVRGPLNRYEEDALLCFVFNIGGSNFGRSSVLRLLNLGDRLAAAGRFRDWDKVRVAGTLTPSKGLRRRRIAESLRFLGGDEASVLDIAENMDMVRL
jgi:lysozyme